MNKSQENSRAFRLATGDRLAVALAVSVLFCGAGKIVSVFSTPNVRDAQAASTLQPNAPMVFTAKHGRLSQGQTYLTGECRRYDVNAPSYLEPPVTLDPSERLLAQDSPDFQEKNDRFDPEEFEKTAPTLSGVAYNPLDVAIGAEILDPEELSWLPNEELSDWAKSVKLPELVEPTPGDAHVPPLFADDDALVPFDGALRLTAALPNSAGSDTVEVRHYGNASVAAEELAQPHNRAQSSSEYVNPTRQASYLQHASPYGPRDAVIQLK